ncbi:MAG: AAA family ATPase, partial [Anaerolineae bacterium]
AGSYGAKEKKTAVSLYTPPSSHRPSFTPFVGRQSEIGRLTAVFEQCRSGRFQSIIITGNSGLGKTRLVNEWLHQLSTNVIVLRGQGHEFEQTIPYRPLLDALQQSLHLIPWAQLPPDSSYAWLAPLAQLLPDLYYHLPNLAATSALTDNETSHHIMEGIIQILAGLARQNKVILFLDDLHWVDMPTWHFLHFLSRRIRQLPLMLIGTFSLPEAGQENKNQLRQLKINGPSQIISLSRLWPADISDLLRQILNQRGQELTHLAHKLHQMSNGNPFYVTELIRALQNSQPSGPYNPAQFDQITLPTAIQTLIENRLDRLDQEHLNMLSIAAAIGREFTYDLLYAITQAEANHLLTQLEDWLDRGLIVERAEGNYDFSHLQIREVVYQRLSRPRRQRIHFQIATAMEQVASSQVEQIAYHYRHSHQPANAIPGLLAAGRRALNTRAYGEARAIGQTLLDISSHAPESATHHNELELNLLLAIASAFTGSTEEALHRLTHASHLAASLDDAAQGSEIALQFAQIHWIRGDAPAARLHAERAMALTQAAPNPVRETAVLRLLGRIAVSQGYYAIAVHYLNKSLEYDTNELNRANTQGYLATAYGHLGQKEPAVLALKEAQRMATQLESPALLAVIQVKAAVAYNALNMLSAAKPLAEQGLATCQAHNMQVYAFIARCVAGRIAHFYCGETAVAYQHLQEAINWAQEENYILFRYLAHLTLAEIAHDTGDQTTLTAQSQIALDLAHRTGNRWVKEQIQRF